MGIYPLSDNSDGVVASELPEIRGLIPGSCPFSSEQKSQREPNPRLVSSRLVPTRFRLDALYIVRRVGCDATQCDENETSCSFSCRAGYVL